MRLSNHRDEVEKYPAYYAIVAMIKAHSGDMSKADATEYVELYFDQDSNPEKRLKDFEKYNEPGRVTRTLGIEVYRRRLGKVGNLN